MLSCAVLCCAGAALCCALTRPTRVAWCAGQTMDAVALIGTNRGLAGYSMVPWIVAAVAKLVNLVMESIYGAVGHYTLFIVSLVFTHWGTHAAALPRVAVAECMAQAGSLGATHTSVVLRWLLCPAGIFCLLAWSMFIASELGEEVAKAPPPATGPGSASYAAGGTDPQEAASSAKLMANAHKVLGWIPVLGGLLGRVEQSQKRQMTTSV